MPAKRSVVRVQLTARTLQKLRLTVSLILPYVKWYTISLDPGRVAPAARRSGLATAAIVLSC